MFFVGDRVSLGESPGTVLAIWRGQLVIGFDRTGHVQTLPTSTEELKLVMRPKRSFLKPMTSHGTGVLPEPSRR
jgi:hypothetical protein